MFKLLLLVVSVVVVIANVLKTALVPQVTSRVQNWKIVKFLRRFRYSRLFYIRKGEIGCW